jgi:MFS transporter, DHA1 family, multidrug resistance protein
MAHFSSHNPDGMNAKVEWAMEQSQFSIIKRRPLLMSLAMLSGMIALSIDMLLPAVPQMTDAFGVSSHGIQATLALFVFTFGIGQLFYGFLSDRFGRRWPLVLSLLLFAMGSTICAVSFRLDVLAFGRGLQGLGACGAAVGFMSILRDCYQGKELVRNLAIVMAMASLAPICAPLIGAFCVTHFSWRLPYGLLTLLSLGMALWFFRFLPETHPSLKQPVSLRRAWSLAFANGTFRQYTAIHTLAFCGLFAYLSVGPSLMIQGKGLSPNGFAIWFSANAVLYGSTNIVVSRAVQHISLARLMLLGALLMLIGGTGMFLWRDQPSAYGFMLPMFIVTIGMACIMPSSQAAAMEPFGGTAATAAALLGFARFTFSSILALIIGGGTHVFPVAVAILTSGACIAVLLFFAFLARFKSRARAYRYQRELGFTPNC